MAVAGAEAIAGVASQNIGITGKGDRSVVYSYLKECERRRPEPYDDGAVKDFR